MPDLQDRVAAVVEAREELGAEALEQVRLVREPGLVEYGWSVRPYSRR